MDHPSVRAGRRLRLAAAGVLAAALTLAPAASAVAAPASGADHVGAAQPARYATSNQLDINMQVQQQNEWCWVGSGATVAAYHGVNVDQNTFCDLAIGYPTSYQCPNRPGYLSWDQNAFSALGISPGTESGAIAFNTVVSEIDGNRPIITGIRWTSGGGHAEVIYGYDQSSQSIYFGDPWPSDNRYNQMSYSAYRSNGQFRWDDSLYQIGA